MRDALHRLLGRGDSSSFVALLGVAAQLLVALGFASAVGAQSTMRQYQFSARFQSS